MDPSESAKYAGVGSFITSVPGRISFMRMVLATTMLFPPLVSLFTHRLSHHRNLLLNRPSSVKDGSGDPPTIVIQVTFADVKEVTPPRILPASNSLLFAGHLLSG